MLRRRRRSACVSYRIGWAAQKHRLSLWACVTGRGRGTIRMNRCSMRHRRKVSCITIIDTIILTKYTNDAYINTYLVEVEARLV
jgi:hypothetical protein